MRASDLLAIGEVAERAGVAPSTLRYYEDDGLIRSERAANGHRRFRRDVLRRVAFIKVAQTVGLSLVEIRDALGSLPAGRTPTTSDWEVLAQAWMPRIDERIEMLERLRHRLTSCIGCGCLSMAHCGLMNPADLAAESGPGARYVIGEGPEPD